MLLARNFLSLLDRIVLGICFLYIILFLVIHCICKLEPLQAVEKSAAILHDSIHVAPAIVGPHNATLLSVLEEREASEAGHNTSQQGLLWQVRTFYSIILAGLASLLFTGRLKDNEKRDVRQIRLVLLWMIPLMYLLEVHLEDLRQRSEVTFGETLKAVELLANKSPTDSTWYVLNYKNLNNLQTAASHWPDVWRRKLGNAIRCPDSIQIVYYFFPWLALCWFVRAWTSKGVTI